MIRLGRVAEGAADVRRSVDMELQRGGRLQAAVGLEELGQALQKAGDLPAAYRAFTQYRALAQEHTRADRRALLAKAQQGFDAQQREIEAKLLTEQNALREQTIRAQRLRYGMAALVVLGALGLIVLLALLVRRLRRTNRLLARSNRDLAALSEVDPLTGLGNRRAMQGLLSGFKPVGSQSAALALIDIDHFKMLNDQHGHAVGDLVLQAIAGRLRGAVREGDRVVRWGGEEFLIWLAEADAELLQDLMRRVLNDIAGHPVALRDGRSVNVSVSIGALAWPLGALSWPGDKAVDAADVLMYLAKSRGRNQAWCLLDARVPDFAALRSALADFNAAEERGELRLAQLVGPGGPR
jgi:diguanylate cyclase (GGDEF)-like protein